MNTGPTSAYGPAPNGAEYRNSHTGSPSSDFRRQHRNGTPGEEARYSRPGSAKEASGDTV
ncbi:hypothetical protein [Lentzea sp. CA-135723]|uniref:hypothetical protein n=1 Tax=Lentzea sp. CA-135723 TaxID=3239950 RepID=UPI003D8DA828